MAAVVDRFEAHPQRSTAVVFPIGGGAIERVPADATAFVQRDCMASIICFVGWKQGEDPSAHVRWIKQYFAPIERFTHGFYVNDLTADDTPAAIQANYRRNHDRLVAVKNRYDPRNLFRLNANVKPTITRAAGQL